MEVIVIKEKNGKPSVIEWKGETYILQPKSLYKGKKKPKQQEK